MNAIGVYEGREQYWKSRRWKLKRTQDRARKKRQDETMMEVVKMAVQQLLVVDE